jgi:hypothetical protein
MSILKVLLVVNTLDFYYYSTTNGVRSLPRFATVCSFRPILSKWEQSWNSTQIWANYGTLRLFMKGKYNDKNTIRLPRQHMQKSDGGICNEGHCPKAWHG